MKRSIILGVGLVALAVGGFFGYQIYFSKPTINDFVASLKDAGLTVNPITISSEEAAVVDRANKDLAPLANHAPSDPGAIEAPVETGRYDIGGIKQVKISRFDSETAAQNYLNFVLRNELIEDNNARAHDFKRIDKTEYFRAGKYLVLGIDYFDGVGAANGKMTINLRPVDVPADDLAKLRNAASAWKK